MNKKGSVWLGSCVPHYVAPMAKWGLLGQFTRRHQRAKNGATCGKLHLPFNPLLGILGGYQTQVLFRSGFALKRHDPKARPFGQLEHPLSQHPEPVSFPEFSP